MLAITGATVKTITKGTLEGATVLIEGTKIKEIITCGDIPNGIEKIDAAGKIITPGLIDVHTHLGLMEEGSPVEDASVNEMTDPVTPHMRVVDAINPADPGFLEAVKGGVTCVQVVPGSANVVGGQGAVLKTNGQVVDEMIIKSPSGMKVAFGENPKRVYWQQKKLPSTRMGTAACLRQTLIEAQNYREKMASTKEKGTEGFERNLKMEALLDVLAGKVPLRAHAHRADDIVTAIRIAEEFNLQYTIEHCTEGDKIAGYLAQKNVRAAVGPTLSSRSKLELKDMGWHTVVALNKAGVKTSITTDHPVIPVQYLTINAAMAVRAGLDEDEALKAITITAAEHLGMEDRLGSIEPGKDADLVIWSGDPFHYKSRVEMTIIDGKRVG